MSKNKSTADSGRATLTDQEVELATFIAEIQDMLGKGYRLPKGHDEFVEQYYALTKQIGKDPKSVKGFYHQVRLMRNQLTEVLPQQVSNATQLPDDLSDLSESSESLVSAVQSSASDSSEDNEQELEEMMRQIESERMSEEEITKSLADIKQKVSKLKYPGAKMPEIASNQIRAMLALAVKLHEEMNYLQKNETLNDVHKSSVSEFSATLNEITENGTKILNSRLKSDPILAEAGALLETLTKNTDRYNLTTNNLKNEFGDVSRIVNKFPSLFMPRLIELRDKITAAVDKALKQKADILAVAVPSMETPVESVVVEAPPKQPDVHDLLKKQLNAKIMASNQVLGKVLNKLSAVEIADMADKTRDMLFELEKWKNSLPENSLTEAELRKYDRNVKNLNTFIKIIDAKKGEPMLASAVNRVLTISDQFAKPDEKVHDWVQDLVVEVRTITQSDRYQDCSKQRLGEDLQSVQRKEAPTKVHSAKEMKAFEAIEKLSNLLKRVELFKNVPIISSYLKGQVKEQLKILTKSDVQTGLKQLAGPARETTMKPAPKGGR
ncbi:MAG: hypothetical protein M3R00_06425 [Pseudomonadota bacterium]|nr:hypothetical protein [Pseudomonadota bacterium]